MTFWVCLGCEESGAGKDGDRQAEKHGKATSHSTMTSTVDLRLWNGKANTT